MLAHDKGILNPDNAAARENKLWLNGYRLVQHQGGVETFCEQRHFVQFEADTVTYEFGLFAGCPHKASAKAGMSRHLFSEVEYFGAKCAGMHGLCYGRLNCESRVKGSLQVGCKITDDEHTRHVENVPVEDTGIVNQDRFVTVDGFL
jgi:hypothetical protein